MPREIYKSPPSPASPASPPSVTCTSPYGRYAICRTVLKTRLERHPRQKGWIPSLFKGVLSIAVCVSLSLTLLLVIYLIRIVVHVIKDTKIHHSVALFIYLTIFYRPWNAPTPTPHQCQKNGDTCYLSLVNESSASNWWRWEPKWALEHVRLGSGNLLRNSWATRAG